MLGKRAYDEGKTESLSFIYEMHFIHENIHFRKSKFTSSKILLLVFSCRHLEREELLVSWIFSNKEETEEQLEINVRK